jgi:hypothetical protein
MWGQVLFSLVVMIIGIGTLPELWLFWAIIAGIIWLPASIVIGGIILGLSVLMIV